MWGKRKEVHGTRPAEAVAAGIGAALSTPPASPALSQSEAGVAEQVARHLHAVSLTTPEPRNQSAPQDAAIAAQTPAPNGSRLIRANPISTAFGDMVALLAKSPAHKHLSLVDLEWLLVPPVVLDQMVLADANFDNGTTVLAAFVLWARVSPEIDTRLSQNLQYPVRLHPNEWKSGDIFYIIDAVGERKIIEKIVKQTATEVFRSKPFKVVTPITKKQACLQ